MRTSRPRHKMFVPEGTPKGLQRDVLANSVKLSRSKSKATEMRFNSYYNQLWDLEVSKKYFTSVQS